MSSHFGWDSPLCINFAAVSSSVAVMTYHHGPGEKMNAVDMVTLDTDLMMFVAPENLFFFP